MSHPHRDTDWQRIAAERETRCAELSEELGVLRGRERAEKLRAWAKVLLVGAAFGSCSVAGISLAVSLQHAQVPEPCKESATVLNAGHDRAGYAIQRCDAGAILSAEPLGDGASVLVTCVCTEAP